MSLLNNPNNCAHARTIRKGVHSKDADGPTLYNAHCIDCDSAIVEWPTLIDKEARQRKANARKGNAPTAAAKSRGWGRRR